MQRIHKTITLLLVAFLLGQHCWAQDRLNIAGQEGDERFFPLIRSIYEQIGLDVSFTLLPSERALSSVNSGLFDAEVGRVLAPAEKYPNLEYSREPLLAVELIALARKGSRITIASPEDLRHYRVGSLIGMSIAEGYIQEHGLQVLAVPSHDQLAQMLGSGRLDVVLMGSAFTQSPVFHVGERVKTLSTLNVFHVYNKKHAYLVHEFDSVLRSMKSDGRYEQYLPGTTSRTAQ